MKFLAKILLVLVTVTASVTSKNIPEKASRLVESTTREPSLQAYGLPKRALINTGEIERVQFTARFADDEKSTKPKHPLNFIPPLAPTYLMRSAKDDIGIEGHIERISRPVHHPIAKRSTENEEDLQGEETKVFRPLFVYRQQVEDRHRKQRRPNPIYGAYQYGTRRPVNHSRDCGHKNSRDAGHMNALY